jgi:hypothetical protein
MQPRRSAPRPPPSPRARASIGAAAMRAMGKRKPRRADPQNCRRIHAATTIIPEDYTQIRPTVDLGLYGPHHSKKQNAQERAPE